MDYALKRKFVNFMMSFNRKYPFHTVTKDGKNEIFNSYHYGRVGSYAELSERLISKRRWTIVKEYYTTNTPQGIALHFQDGQTVNIVREIDHKKSKNNQTIGHSIGRFFFPLRRDAIKFVLDNRKEL